MFRALALLASLVGVSAFAPAGRMTSSSSLRMQFNDERGVLAPVGYWDPLGLAADGDEAVFARRRATEIKHGRVAMAAVLGYIIQEVARFPGAIDLDGTSFEAIPNGVAAIGQVPIFGWIQIIGSVGYWELVKNQQQSDEPGDFGWGYFGKKLDGEEKEEKLTKELQNGRLAMLGIMALMTHDVAKPAGEGLFVLHHF
jgi:hypothetical protein